MRLSIKYEKVKKRIYRISVIAEANNGLKFHFKSIFLFQGQQLSMNMPYIRMAPNKRRVAFIFSRKLKDFIAYHVVADKKQHNTIILDFNENQTVSLNKVKGIKINFGNIEVLDMYNVLIGKDIRIKHVCLIQRKEQIYLSFPKNTYYKDICNPADAKTRTYLESLIA